MVPLFEYHTDNHLKAWPMRFGDADLNTGNKPKLVYNEYGGAVGGPIKKNKLFYFVSYEGTGDHRNVQTFATVPLPAMLKGDLSASTTPVYDPLSGDPATRAWAARNFGSRPATPITRSATPRRIRSA